MEDFVVSFFKSTSRSPHRLGAVLEGPGVFGISGVSDSEDLEDRKLGVLLGGGLELELSESSFSEEELSNGGLFLAVGDCIFSLSFGLAGV